MPNASSKIAEWTLNDLAAEKRLIAQRGGTRSGKTYSIMQVLFTLAEATDYAIDVVSESLPHLKRGALHDWREILTKAEVENYTENKTDGTFTFNTGAVVRFFSVDDWGKVKGARRDVLFINEANRIDYESYRQLAVRTTRSIIIDWNPDCEFWYEAQGLNVQYPPHVSTYKDNVFLDAAQVAEIESNRNDTNWWRVYGLGEVGRVESMVYTRWEQVAEIPATARLIGYGLDFGFMADPTALVAVYMQDGLLWLDECIYEKGLTNDRIAAKIMALPPAPIVADSAEQKSIAEIRNYGVKQIEPAVKGADSILNGIDVVSRYDMKVTQRSLNVIDELRHYKWQVDKISGKITNRPIDRYNHAMDAVRYLVSGKLSNRPRTEGLKRFTIK